MNPKLLLSIAAVFCFSVTSNAEEWTIDTQADWHSALADQEDLMIQGGVAMPKEGSATFRSKLKRFSNKRFAASIVFEQAPLWQNWQPIGNVGPVNLGDAPVLLCLAPNDYWMFGRYGGRRPKNMRSKPVQLDGFNIPMMSTPYPNQYDAPGGLKPSAGGYHAWQSRDMINWVHHGSVTERFSKWVTTAEYADGKVYIYYDYPNDQDPHLYIDEDLEDGKPGINEGIAFRDPSHGSDCGIIRDARGHFHLIYEDWSPINARTHSWDSPLAGHAVSENGVHSFKILDPAVDQRTEPTGEVAEYEHPHWLQHPDWKTNIAKYNVHRPEQEAYGDWAPICVGGRYYLFGDYDPVGKHAMSVGWFTSPDLNEPFRWCDNIGEGHPDPDIGFAEGRFYLVTQQETDFVSSGPWVATVEARLGVDVDDDGTIDQWTTWQKVEEKYSQRKGFAKQIDKTAASIDTQELPAGHAFGFECRLTDTTENKSKPMLDRVTLTFK